MCWGAATVLATFCVLFRIIPCHLVYRWQTSDFSAWQAGQLLHLFLKAFKEQVHSCVCCDGGRECVLALCPQLCLGVIPCCQDLSEDTVSEPVHRSSCLVSVHLPWAVGLLVRVGSVWWLELESLWL